MSELSVGFEPRDQSIDARTSSASRAISLYPWLCGRSRRRRSRSPGALARRCSGGGGKQSAAKSSAACANWGQVVKLDNGDASGSIAYYTQMRDLYKKVEGEAPSSVAPDLRVLIADEQQLVNTGSDSPSESAARDRYLRRLRGRGRALSIDQICHAALGVIDDEGLRKLTMRRLAEELGTGPASLYTYVTSREELLVEVADLVLGELVPPDPALEWRGAVERLAHDLRRILVGHRGVVVISSNAPLLGPNAMRLREMFWSVMDRDGCSPPFAVQVYSSVMHFVVCSAIFSAGVSRRGDTAWSGNAPPGLHELLDLLPSRRYPTVIKFSDYVDPPDPEHDFTVGLRALIDGLARSQRDE